MLELRIRRLLLFLAAWAASMLGNVCLSAETQQTTSENRSGVQSKVAALTPADYIRNDFTVEDGLLNNIIHAIVETENGMLWIGTQSGLASFDGREFKTINLQTEGAPAQGTVHSLLESSRGDLWAATDAGVVRIPEHALDRLAHRLAGAQRTHGVADGGRRGSVAENDGRVAGRQVEAVAQESRTPQAHRIAHAA